MEREEAIQALKDLADMNVRYGCDDKWITALHLAIEALQADIVSREDKVTMNSPKGLIKCGECVRHDNCWIFDEHKDDNGTCVWAESKSITESSNDVIESQNDVIEVVRCKDCRHKVMNKDGEYNEEDIVCDYWLSDGLDSNDFCSYGERSEPCT